MNQQFIDEVKIAKSSFYKKSVANLKQTNPSKWYSALKRLSSYDQRLHEIPRVEEINDFSDDEQAELIADKFSKIPNEYEPLKTSDILIPSFDAADIPNVSETQVYIVLLSMK